MKSRVVLAIAAAILASFATLNAAEPKRPEPDHFEWALQTRMHNEGVLASAGGKVDLHSDQHGSHTHQDLHLHLQGLDANATYTLTAQVDTNSIEAVTFSPDLKGKADIHLHDKGPGHPHGHPGHIDDQLPAELQPVTMISALSVSDTNGTAILTADLTAPDKFEYHAKRDLSTDSIDARLDIHADTHKGEVRLHAKGLQAGASYSLAFEGNVVASATARDDGHLDLHAHLQNPADALSLGTVALLDADGNTVLSTTIP